MKKQTNIGKALTRKEQKLILGGGRAIAIMCADGDALVVTCASGFNGVGNVGGGNIKCCSTTVDCCRVYYCDGTSGYTGSASPC